MAPVQKTSSKRKGKSVDKSTPWSENKWDDERQKWYATRLDPSGEVECQYYDPEETKESSVATPRTPGDTLWTDNESQYIPLSTSTTYSQLDSSNNSQSPLSINHPELHYTTTTNTTVESGDESSRYNQPAQTADFLGATFYPHLRNDGSLAGPSGSHFSAPDYEEKTISVTRSFHALSIDSPILEEGNSGATSDLEQQILNAKKIKREPGSKNYEELDDRYRVVEDRKQNSFWKVGRVFMMLWTEPARHTQLPSNGGTRNGSHLSTVYLKGTVFSEIRRFVVISTGYGNTICSPIQTYSGQGTLKPNLPEADQHAIIYTSKTRPDELKGRLEDGTIIQENLIKDPIRVVSERKDQDGKLHHASRLNYSKIYTVENYVRVLNIGMVHRSSMESLLANCLVRPRSDPQPPRKR